MVATPVETVDRDRAAARIVAEAGEAEAHAIMVGLPRSLSGAEGPAADKSRRFAGELVELLSREGSDAEVYLLDERLTRSRRIAPCIPRDARGARIARSSTRSPP